LTSYNRSDNMNFMRRQLVKKDTEDDLSYSLRVMGRIADLLKPLKPWQQVAILDLFLTSARPSSEELRGKFIVDHDENGSEIFG
jgi:hypothetical protein